ncbi:MAG: bifunctional DNA-formamidopyrimidine glycosylase/DNA-(apurinic or apyrimidinic site) lyase [Acidobacteria bacterium]|nr:bifunctional DNA-formamidopyrimidine glycosylase/DNA-(apurinic or apyrimidinic site) lyase [Acidobacteriota bacterium]
MPELPEVETIRRALAREILGYRVTRTTVRERRLRRPVSVASLRRLEGGDFTAIGRRAKYLLLSTGHGHTAVIHLGMTGRVDVFSIERDFGTHDHVEWELEHPSRGPLKMRFHDPRRFGVVARLKTSGLARHRMFAHLGPEPLSSDFGSDHLWAGTRGSRRPIKNAMMDARLVVGVGNIYASEALWRAGVHPARPAGRISRLRLARLHDEIVNVLGDAIDAGGTTLSDYRDPAGESGYFQVRLDIYDRANADCRRCGRIVRRIVQAGRSTYYCPGCQR